VCEILATRVEHVFWTKKTSGSYKSYIENLNSSLYGNVRVTEFLKKHVICLELVDLHIFCIVPLFSVD
jgi:hypothetical protein